MSDYEHPNYESDDESPRTSPRNWKDYSPAFDGAMWTGLKIQVAFAVMTALVLDMGQTHRAFWVAMLCQWAAVFIILLRRPMIPTKFDLAIVRYGILPMLLVIMVWATC